MVSRPAEGARSIARAGVIACVFAIGVLWPGGAGAATTEDCGSVREMDPHSRFIQDVTIDDLLHELAPRSKLLLTASGALIMTDARAWYYVSADQDVVVRIQNLSRYWLSLADSLLPRDVDERRPLITELRRALTEREECAVDRLTRTLAGVFCYERIEDIESLLKGFGHEVVDMRSLKREQDLADEAKARARSGMNAGTQWPQALALIYYRGYLIYLDGNNRVRSVIEWDGDQNTLVNLRRQIEQEGYLRSSADGPPFGIVTTGSSTHPRPIGREVVPPDDLSGIPENELEARGLGSGLSGTSPGPGRRGSGVALESASRWEMHKQFCPFNLSDAAAAADSGYGGFLFDTDSDSLWGTGSPGDWAFIAGPECYKCGGIEESARAHLVSPLLEAPLKIERFGGVRSHSHGIAPVARMAVQSAIDGSLPTSDLDALGAGGYTYTAASGELVLVTPQSRWRFREPSTLTYDAFKAWSRLMANGSEIELQKTSPRDIVATIFEFCAMARDEWRKYFRQDPMAFARKYCTEDRAPR